MDLKSVLEIAAAVVALAASVYAVGKWQAKMISKSVKKDVIKLYKTLKEEQLKTRTIEERIFHLAMGKSLKDILEAEKKT